MQIQVVRKRLPLIIALACGVWAILLLNSYLGRRESEIWEKIKQSQGQAQPSRPQAQMGIALVAAKSIAPQVPITPADLLIKEIPAEYIQPGAVASLDEVIGQIASSPIAAGEQILKTKLLPPGKIGKSLSEITPAGKRAVSTSVDNMSSIANLLRPGDYVDVLVLITLPEITSQLGAKTSEPRLISLFQNVEVLAVGGEFVAPLESSGVRKEQIKAPSAPSGTVTLALNPQEAVLLSFVQEHGKIKLALRSAEDNKKETVKPADWDALLQYLYPAKDGSVGGRPVVEIYRGLNKEVVPLSEK
ncbi:MAG: Flp pilus assembly protein CpaB [Candidatus Omnitrophota bacterium]